MSVTIHTKEDLKSRYLAYLKTISSSSLTSSDLHPFVAASAVHNTKPLDIDGYRALMPTYAKLDFKAEKVIVDLEERIIAAQLKIGLEYFEPKEHEGKEYEVLAENVFYQLDSEWKIKEVWSVIESREIRKA
ncbi:hypothetical protein DL96DRAFT_649700 [Flagelloscypha sp. PMI_526]|nr:hypothetical protein DL96DRAFT_649700 [Flagelloscypha sp. PMI_526]